MAPPSVAVLPLKLHPVIVEGPKPPFSSSDMKLEDTFSTVAVPPVFLPYVKVAMSGEEATLPVSLSNNESEVKEATPATSLSDMEPEEKEATPAL